MYQKKQKLFRNKKVEIIKMLKAIEGYTFREDPLSFFIVLARYKFATRFLKNKYTVLDAGCGLGHGSLFLSKFSKKVVGGDIDEEMVNHNNKEYKSIKNLSFKQLDLLSPTSSFINNFDAIVSIDVIEHFEEKKVKKVAKNYSKMLKKNGFAIIGTPNINSRKYASSRRLNSHPYEFSYDSFDKVLRSSFSNVFIFSMTDEIVSTQFPKMAWYLMAICTK